MDQYTGAYREYPEVQKCQNDAMEAAAKEKPTTVMQILDYTVTCLNAI